jgi:hypothetical protein
MKKLKIMVYKPEFLIYTTKTVEMRNETAETPLKTNSEWAAQWMDPKGEKYWMTLLSKSIYGH